MPSSKFILWPDTHIPHHDPDAVDCAVQIVDWWQPQILGILGDFLDCSPVSHWLKNKRRSAEGLRLADDYAVANKLLDRITKSIDHLVYIEGNHEDWINDALEANPEFTGLIELEHGLKFAERRRKHKITQLPYGQGYMLGHLYITHGTYTGVNHAKKHVESFGRSVAYGHLHDVQVATKVSPIDVQDKHMGYCLGCLCNKNPKYMENKPNNWSHALGLGEVRHDGGFNLYPIIICDGVASFAGVTFKARRR